MLFNNMLYNNINNYAFVHFEELEEIVVVLDSIMT